MNTSEEYWNFQSYEKISESDRNWMLEPSLQSRLLRMEWVVTEKIHGANFSLMTDGEAIACAKRKALLGENDDFFHFQKVRSRLAKPLLQLHQLLRETRQAVKIYLFGELFGGAYPHPDVPPLPELTPVQTGIYYSPDIEFCAFDLGLDDGDKRYFLDFEDFQSVLEQVGILFSAPLLLGSFREAMDYDIHFESTLPALLNLPALPPGNKAEGVVLKPAQTVLLQTGKGITRPLLKRKIPEFAEDQRFHGARKSTRSEPTRGRSLLDELEWELMGLINTNRLNNVRSKFGEVHAENKKDLLNDFLADVKEELLERKRKDWELITEEDRDLLGAVIEDECNKLIGRV